MKLSGIKTAVIGVLILIALTAVRLPMGADRLFRDQPVLSIPAGQVHSSVFKLLRPLKINGTVENWVLSVAGDVYLSGTIKGQLVVLGGTAVLMPAAVVEGNIIVLGGSLQRAQEAEVTGKVFVLPPLKIAWRSIPEELPLEGLSAGRGFFWPGSVGVSAARLLSLLISFVAGGFVLILAPRWIGSLACAVREGWLRFTLIGAAVYAATIIGLFLLAITIVGLPVALIVAVVLVASLAVGQVAVAVFMGQQCWRAVGIKVGSTGALFSGLVILFAVRQLPLINKVVSLWVACLGLGTVVCSLVPKRKDSCLK